MAVLGLAFRKNTPKTTIAEPRVKSVPICTPSIVVERFESTRFTKDEVYEKPWLEVKNPRQKWEKILFWSSLGLGVVIGAAICYLSYSSVTNLQYCLAMEDTFSSINPKYWNYEIQRGGYGTGSFDWTTDDPQNIYTDAEGLHIVPTLTLNTTNITLAQLTDGYVLNLTTAHTCTGTTKDDCSIRSNKTSGAIINPVRSARINTKGKMTLKYGRVEVVAKQPQGDWLWPAIWMLPENDVYGTWPASGEIDIAESKGNDGDTYANGRDSVSSTLHWGPISQVDAFWRTSGKHNIRRTDYSEAFHTYGLEWNSKYLFMYLDSRLLQVLFIRFGKENMWDRGQFGKYIVNKTALYDPWSQTGNSNTPFDQDFYLILNVAVGSTNGYFADSVGNKPWADASLIAPSTFWAARSQWYPTWGEGAKRGMTVQSVKMWREGACSSK